MKFFHLVFEKLITFNIECEYKFICTEYRNDSFICTKEVDKSYCGVYRQLE